MAGQALIRIVEPGAVERQHIVERKAGRERRARREACAVKRHQERQRLHQMRRDALPDASLLQRLPHESEFEIAQIAQAAMHKFRIVRACRMGEIVLLDQRDRKTAQRRIAGDAGARHPAADDQQVEAFIGETFEIAAHVRNDKVKIAAGAACVPLLSPTANEVKSKRAFGSKKPCWHTTCSVSGGSRAMCRIWARSNQDSRGGAEARERHRPKTARRP